jgi:hypothetical protein
MLTQTVQIVTIPLNKKGWSKWDLLFTGKSYKISPANRFSNHDWQTQQLLVLSDDEIQEGDSVYDLVNNRVELIIGVNKESEVCKFKGGAFDLKYTKKLIASYPQLEGTLPISKETIQVWIDAGTPGEGSVKLVEGHYIPSTYDQPDNWVSFDVTRPEVDPKGNLLLEFGNPLNNLIKKNDYNWLPIDETIQEFAVKSKPSIPTDEEIEKKAEQSATEWWASEPDPGSDALFTEEFNDIKEKWAKQDYCCGYEDGYTQALKDMGYE